MPAARRPPLLRTTSLRGTIAAGYLLGFVFLVAFAAILFANLAGVEERFRSYAGISRFLDTVLEMRRYEKNYLLYGKREDLDAAIAWAGSAASLVAGEGPGGAAPGEVRALRGAETARLLAAYAARLREAGDAAGAPDEAVLAAIRDAGRQLTVLAERISSAEGEYIQASLRAGRQKLVVLVLVFLVGTLLLARVVRSTALRPLEELEAAMQRIAAGERRMLPVDTGRAELDSMNAAFNRMIGEIFEHREEVMRKERLASLGTMLAGVAHELNNPLSNVSTSAELLEEGGEKLDADGRRELVRQIVSETDRATEIIRTVLEYSREPHLDRRPTRLLSTLLDSVLLVRGELPTGVSVDLDVAPELEVLAHKGKLQQAFVNLLTNGIDAMREARRTGAIAIAARLVPGEEAVEIAVRDTGAGIPRHVMDRIFDPFFSTKDVGHGTGLGLFLTHRIVEQHGGTIRVESTLGEGTTVVIRLPRIEAAAAGDAARAAGA